MKVSAAEFQKNFGRYREKARSEAVTVTSYGRDSVVLLSIEEYQRLKSRDQGSFDIGEAEPDDLQAMLESEPHPDAAAFEHEVSSKA